MSIATVSVAATALVAVGSMALQAWLDNSRRRHERHLSLQALRVEASGDFLNALEGRHRSVSRLSAFRSYQAGDAEIVAELAVHQGALGELARALRRLRLVMPGQVRLEADQLLELSEGVRTIYGDDVDIDELVAHDKAMTVALRSFEEHIAAVIQSPGRLRVTDK